MQQLNPLPQLAALDFSQEISQMARGFTGRAWLLADIETWLTNPRGASIFLLQGGPGSGKSTLAAHLIQTHPWIVAHHFCRVGRNETLVPSTILRSLAAQLAVTLPGYGLALANTIKPTHLSVHVQIQTGQVNQGEVAGVIIQNLHAPDPQEAFNILLTSPIAALPSPPEVAVIILDGLDEAVAFRGDPNLVQLLESAAQLPPWVRLFCTTRPHRGVLRYFEGEWADVQPYVLSPDSADNLADIEAYSAGRAEHTTIAQRLQQAGLNTERLVTEVVRLSAGNFLYTRVLMDDIEAGRQPLDDLSRLPQGLDQIYHGFLRRFTPEEWQRVYQPLLGTLAVAAQPLTEGQLRHFTGIGASQTRHSLGVAKQFLHITPPVPEDATNPADRIFSLFHQSLRDYLLAEHRSQDFWCPAEEGHQRIVDHYLAAGSPPCSQWDQYGLAHLVEHLYHLRTRPEDRRRLFDVLTPDLMRAKRQQFGSHTPFAQDLRLALSAARESQNLVQEIRCGLFHSTLAEWATNLPSDFLTALAALGRVEEARSLAVLKQPEDQVTAYQAIGEGFIEGGALATARDELRHALAIAEELSEMQRLSVHMSDTPLRVNALRALVRPMAQVGLAQPLVDAAQRLSDPGQRATLLAAVGSALATADPSPELAELLHQALTLAQSEGEPLQRLNVQLQIAAAWVESGETEQACHLVSTVLTDLDSLSAEVGLMERIDLTAQVMAILIHTGETAQGLLALAQVQEQIQMCEEASYRASARTALAEALSREEALPQAAHLLNTLMDEAVADVKIPECNAFERNHQEAMNAMALNRLLPLLVQCGRGEQALSLVQEITSRGFRDVAYRALVEGLIRYGQMEEGLAAATRIQSGQIQAQALAQLIRGWLAQGDQEQAAALLSKALASAELPAFRQEFAQMQVAFATALARAGRQDLARTVAIHAQESISRIDDVMLRGWAQRDVTVALASVGELDQAFDLLTTLGRDDHPSALLSMIPVLAQLGALERVQQEIPNIHYPGWRRAVEDALAHALNDPGTGLDFPSMHAADEEMAEQAVWRAEVSAAFDQNRAAVFRTLAASALPLVAIDQGKTLWAIYQAVCEVESRSFL